MVIYPTSDVKGQFNGRYRTIVGNASNYYDLVGRYDIDGDDTHGTLGWLVNRFTYLQYNMHVHSYLGQ